MTFNTKLSDAIKRFGTGDSIEFRFVGGYFWCVIHGWGIRGKTAEEALTKAVKYTEKELVFAAASKSFDKRQQAKRRRTSRRKW